MSKIFLSFLGANKYVSCNYYYGDKKVENVSFIQEALIKMFCNDFTEKDRIVIFLTDKARKENWESINNEDLLKNKITNMNIKARLLDVSIPEGKNVDEIWEIFSIIYNVIVEGDEILLDITHAFRSIPMLSMVLLNYTRFLKNIKVKGIYYGAFEVLGTRKEVESMDIKYRNAPIFNLTDFDILQQWGFAVENFVNYGITEKLYKLIDSDAKEILKRDNTNNQAKIMRSFASNLNNISNYFTTVRGNLIVGGANFAYLKKNMKELKISDNNYYLIKLLTPLIIKIHKKIDKYKENDVLNVFYGVEWCIENNLIQQGITLLQEAIITFILKEVKLSWDNLENRNIVSNIIKAFNIKENKLNWPDILKNNKDKVKRIENSDFFKKLSPLFEKLRNYRNDINHAGFLPNARKPEKFKKRLEEVYSKVKSIVIIG